MGLGQGLGGKKKQNKTFLSDLLSRKLNYYKNYYKKL